MLELIREKEAEFRAAVEAGTVKAVAPAPKAAPVPVAVVPPALPKSRLGPAAPPPRGYSCRVGVVVEMVGPCVGLVLGCVHGLPAQTLEEVQGCERCTASPSGCEQEDQERREWVCSGHRECLCMALPPQP